MRGIVENCVLHDQEYVGRSARSRSVNDNRILAVPVWETCMGNYKHCVLLPERKARFAWGYVCKEYISHPRTGPGLRQLAGQPPQQRAGVCICVLRPSLMNNLAECFSVGRVWWHSGLGVIENISRDDALGANQELPRDGV